MLHLIPHRFLIWNFVKRDIHSRYIGSLLGIYWSIINPLIILLVYIVIFGIFFLTRLPGSTSVWDYALYFSSGFLPWSAFSSSVTRSASSILDNKNYVKKVPFPSEIFPIYITLSELLNLFIGIGIYIILFFILKGSPSIFIIILPLAILLQFIFSLGLAFIVSSASVFFRDIPQMIGTLFFIWFWLTPIVYTTNLIPENYLWLEYLNPAYYMMVIYRDILFYGELPSFWIVLPFLIFSFLLLVVGYYSFRKLKRGFTELL